MPPIPELEAIRRTQILEAAQATIAQRGCANVTMEDIARAAGLSKGGLAHYYKSKKELFKAVFEAFFDEIFQRGRTTMAGFKGPMAKLLSFGWLYDREDPALDVGYPILFDFMSIVVHDEEYRGIFHNWINNWIELLQGALEAGIKRGVFAGLNPEQTARTISAIYQGVATRWYLDPASHTDDWAKLSITQAITGLMQPYLTTTTA